MMQAMLNAVRLQVQRALSSLVVSRVGAVTSFDPNTMTAVVALQPDGELTTWIPVSSQWIGNGWGMFAPPNVGDLVKVVYIHGDSQNGMIVGRFYTSGQALPAPSGEFWLVHKSGSFLKLMNDGTIASSGTWNHTGILNVSNNVTVANQTIDLANHKHFIINVSTGTSTLETQTPTG